MTRNPDTVLTLALLAACVAVALLRGRAWWPRRRMSDAEAAERFPATIERMRSRHFH